MHGAQLSALAPCRLLSLEHGGVIPQNCKQYEQQTTMYPMNINCHTKHKENKFQIGAQVGILSLVGSLQSREAA